MIVTINTDAGFYPIEKVGAFAYWIRGTNLFLRGSGVFKSKCTNPLDAEMKAIINAMHILLNTDYKADKIIFNRDNIYAKSGTNGTPLEKMLAKLIKKMKKRSIPVTHPNYIGNGYVEFRHVKAHKHTENARHWVNDWCDKQCKQELRNYKKNLLNNKTEQE